MTSIARENFTNLLVARSFFADLPVAKKHGVPKGLRSWCGHDEGMCCTTLDCIRFLLSKFEKPGRRENFDYPDMVRESGRT